MVTMMITVMMGVMMVMTTFRVAVVTTSWLEVQVMTVISSMREMIKLRSGEALTH